MSDDERDSGERNPWEVLDLDPALDMAELTALLRERAEDLEPDARAEIQGLWQALTVNPRTRAAHALLARPRLREAASPNDLLRVEQLAAARRSAQPVDAEALVSALTALDLALPPTYTPRSDIDTGTWRAVVDAALSTPLDQDSFFDTPDGDSNSH